MTYDENENIACQLTRRAADDPMLHAVVCPVGRRSDGNPKYSHLTYDQLERESNLIAAGLTGYGIAPGDRVVLMVKPSLEFFALTFALFKAGAVPVLIDPGMGIRHLKQCLREADPHAFIGIPAAHIARMILDWPPYGKQRRLVTTGRLPWGGAITINAIKGHTHPDASSDSTHHQVAADPKEAAILFTSGSTGVAKGAVYHHRHFQAQVALIRNLWQIKPGEFDLCTFPLFALFAPALGMTAIVPEMDFTRPAKVDPRRILEAFNHYPITNMFGSPALLSRIAFADETRRVGRTPIASLKRVVSAGAPAVLATIEAMARLLPAGVEVHTPYGATEALPVASIGSDEIIHDTARSSRLGAGICVGRPVAATTVAIIKISDAPLSHWSDDLRTPVGTIGEIVVRGPQVTETYFHRPLSDRLGKIEVPGESRPFHRMGDLGYFDDSGRLWFCGRKSHRVSLAGRELFTIPIESVFNNHAAVRRTALVGIPSDTPGMATPVLCVEPHRGASLSARERGKLRGELMDLAQKHEDTRQIQQILFHRNFPVDIRHNAKIFREKLARWAKRPRWVRWFLTEIMAIGF